MSLAASSVDGCWVIATLSASSLYNFSTIKGLERSLKALTVVEIVVIKFFMLMIFADRTDNNSPNFQFLLGTDWLVVLIRRH